MQYYFFLCQWNTVSFLYVFRCIIDEDKKLKPRKGQDMNCVMRDRRRKITRICFDKRPSACAWKDLQLGWDAILRQLMLLWVTVFHLNVALWRRSDIPSFSIPLPPLPTHTYTHTYIHIYPNAHLRGSLPLGIISVHNRHEISFLVAALQNQFGQDGCPVSPFYSARLWKRYAWVARLGKPRARIEGVRDQNTW